MAERKQISMWISAESAALLQRLADEQGQPKNRIIEWALAAYATSEPTSSDTSDLLDWRTELSNRVLALESRLEAIEAVGAVRVGAAGKEACSVAVEPVSAVLETVDAEPGIEQVAVKKAEMPACADSTSSKDAMKANPNMKHDAMVKEYRGMGKNGKPLGITKIVAKIRDSGFQTSQVRVNESLERLGLKD